MRWYGTPNGYSGLVYQEEMIEVWKSSVTGSGRKNFLKDSSLLQDETFLTIWLISLES